MQEGKCDAIDKHVRCEDIDEFPFQPEGLKLYIQSLVKVENHIDVGIIVKAIETDYHAWINEYYDGKAADVAANTIIKGKIGLQLAQ